MVEDFNPLSGSRCCDRSIGDIQFIIRILSSLVAVAYADSIRNGRFKPTDSASAHTGSGGGWIPCRFVRNNVRNLFYITKYDTNC